MKKPGENGLDYAVRVHRALRRMIAELLNEIKDTGLPGEHHFYLTFRTDHPDAEIPPALRSRYPEEMTVVLQHQFWDLVVDEQHFAVTLRFSGVARRISVPLEALTAFVDPAAEVGFRFEQTSRDEIAVAPEETEEVAESTGGKVVPLSRFRKG
jgi:hypothetical protein